MIRRYQRKPQPPSVHDGVTVGQYLIGDLDDIDEVARVAGVSGFVRAEVNMPAIGPVLLCRWMNSDPDMGPYREVFRTIKPGGYLATGVMITLFVTSRGELDQWYEPKS